MKVAYNYLLSFRLGCLKLNIFLLWKIQKLFKFYGYWKFHYIQNSIKDLDYLNTNCLDLGRSKLKKMIANIKQSKILMICLF